MYIPKIIPNKTTVSNILLYNMNHIIIRQNPQHQPIFTTSTIKKSPTQINKFFSKNPKIHILNNIVKNHT